MSRWKTLAAAAIISALSLTMFGATAADAGVARDVHCARTWTDRANKHLFVKNCDLRRNRRTIKLTIACRFDPRRPQTHWIPPGESEFQSCPAGIRFWWVSNP